REAGEHGHAPLALAAVLRADPQPCQADPGRHPAVPDLPAQRAGHRRELGRLAVRPPPFPPPPPPPPPHTSCSAITSAFSRWQAAATSYGRPCRSIPPCRLRLATLMSGACLMVPRYPRYRPQRIVPPPLARLPSGRRGPRGKLLTPIGFWAWS